MLGDRLDRTGFAPTFAEEFPEDCTAATFAEHYTLATNHYFGCQDRSRPVAEQASSRTFPGLKSLMVDGRYSPRALSPRVMNGRLMLLADRFTPADAKLYGQGLPFSTAMVSTRGLFSQTYGYFETRLWLPATPGTWPAFWLLPVEKTRENQGRLPEVDALEIAGGPVTLQSGGRPFVLDRSGNPFSTVHYLGEDGQEHAYSNAQGIQNTPKLDLAKPHTFGVLRTPAEHVFYVDDAETFRCPNPGVSHGPLYMVLGVDVADSMGDPSVGPWPAYTWADWIRAWQITVTGEPTHA